MGQIQSGDSLIPQTIDTVQDEILRQARIFNEMHALSYEDFLKCLSDLNIMSRNCLDTEGKQLVFAVKKGTDSTLLWKATVKIACVKMHLNTRKIEAYKFLNLSQFLRVFKTFKSHIKIMVEMEQNNSSRRASQSHGSEELSGELLTATVLMNKVTDAIDGADSPDKEPGENINECCICMERKPDVTLTCAHSYCSPCIEQWNENSETCPSCREISKSEDSWVLSEAPDLTEINQEICTALMGLSVDK